MPNHSTIFGTLLVLFMSAAPVHAQVEIALEFPKPTPKKTSEKQIPKRKPTWSENSPEGRWRCLEYDDLINRDKVSLDNLWLKDNALEGCDDPPEPDVLAQEIADDLQTAWEQFASIAEKVKG